MASSSLSKDKKLTWFVDIYVEKESVEKSMLISKQAFNVKVQFNKIYRKKK